MATLTGASRVAMGIDVPSFFCNNDDLAMKLIDISQKTGDPLWQLPLWENYSSQLNSQHADFKISEIACLVERLQLHYF